jgi:signal transduction histidine kinase
LYRTTFDGVSTRWAVPRSRFWPEVGDWALALALALAGWFAASGSSSSRAALLLLVAAATLPLAVRRRFPLAVLIVVAVATGVAAVVYDDYWPLGVIVALYTVGAHCQRGRSIAVGVGTLVALTVPIGSASEWQLMTLLRMAPLVAAWVVGENLRTRREYLRAVEERAAQLEREQEANARRAAVEEQARIAREVHDVVAHNLSVIVVQATAGDAIFASQPEDAQRALRTIERTARQALDELRRVLGAMHESERLMPQPSLARLEDLVEQVRVAGLPVTLDVVGERRQLPAALEGSTYRIVQEALTNTLRHAKASHAAVTITYEHDVLSVEVVDDGSAAAAANTDGRGLVGMRERTLMFGGDFEAGPKANGGFRVSARLPLTEARR